MASSTLKAKLYREKFLFVFASDMLCCYETSDFLSVGYVSLRTGLLHR